MIKRQLILSVCFLINATEIFADGAEIELNLSKLTIGFRQDAPPFSYLAPGARTPTGYSVDICNRIIFALKQLLPENDITVETVALSSRTRLDAVRNGDVDLHCGTMSHTSEREYSIEFSLPIFITGAAMLTKVTDDFDELSDIGPGVIGLLKGRTTTRNFVLESGWIEEGENNVIKNIESVDAATSELLMGEIDSFITDQVVLLAHHANLPPMKRKLLRVSPQLLTIEKYSIAFPVKNRSFRVFADQVLSDFFRSENFPRLLTRWFADLGAVIKAEHIQYYRSLAVQ